MRLEIRKEDLPVIALLVYGLVTHMIRIPKVEAHAEIPQEVKEAFEWQKPITEIPKTEILQPTHVALIKTPEGNYICASLYDSTTTLGVVIKEYPLGEESMAECVDDAYYQYIQDVYGVPRELVGTYSLIKTNNMYVCAKEPTTVVGEKIAMGLTEDECLRRATELSGVSPQPQVTPTPSTATTVSTATQPISTTQPAQVEVPQSYYEELQRASQNEACFEQCREMNARNMSYCYSQCCTPTEWGGYACDSDCWNNCYSWVVKYHLECVARCS